MLLYTGFSLCCIYTAYTVYICIPISLDEFINLTQTCTKSQFSQLEVLLDYCRRHIFIQLCYIRILHVLKMIPNFVSQIKSSWFFLLKYVSYFIHVLSGTEDGVCEYHTNRIVLQQMLANLDWSNNKLK